MDRWIFQQDPDRYSTHKNLIDRFLSGEIEPMDLGGVLAYMGIGVLSDGGGVTPSGTEKESPCACPFP